MAFVLESPAFRDGEPIPRKYTADGENVSPPLRWSG
ncbi:MAG TPA: YbhB/YbcL family Raf kinase inhibitor-like protein, partial [Pseudolabrys sp.]|nr:YbhB/YbcL family Raf kinase inhibitor-like protein [Pseudolabrys sp.]